MKQLNKIKENTEVNTKKINDAIDIIEKLYEEEWYNIEMIVKKLWVPRSTMFRIFNWMMETSTADKILDSEITN